MFSRYWENEVKDLITAGMTIKKVLTWSYIRLQLFVCSIWICVAKMNTLIQ